MGRHGGKRDGYLGGAGLLAAAAYLCLKGLKAAEERLKKKQKK